MRFTPASLALAALFAMTSSVGLSKSTEQPISAESASWYAKGVELQKSGRVNDAVGAFETAVVADPHNRAAYLALASIARARGLPGQAIALYDRILAFNENDLDALQGQGAAMVDKGAMEMARAVLVRIKAQCKSRCTQADQLSAAIARGAPPKQLTAKEILPQQGGAPAKQP